VNPFEAPAEEAPRLPEESAEWYDRLATLRRRLNLSFLAQLLCLIGWVPFASLPDGPPAGFGGSSTVVAIWACVVIALWITTQVHAFLVLKMTGDAFGAALTVLFLGLPCVGSISVIVATRRAADALRRGGHRVGYLGGEARRP
jgi:hypothetical protein